MASTIFDIFEPRAIVEYWEEVYSNTLPYVGPAIFPNRKQIGLELRYIKGYDRLPPILAPSAFDAQPTIRDRGEVHDVTVKMPFFRESMRIGEQDRQDLMTFSQAGESYATAILQKLYNDTAELINSAETTAEAMRFELLQHGTITILSSAASGENVNYSYNFDQSGAWTAANVVTPSVLWTDPTSNPIADILSIKRLAASKGVTLTRAIIGPDLWAKLLTSQTIRADVFPLNTNASLSDAQLRDFLVAKTGITFAVYEKMYKTLANADKGFMDASRVVFLPATPVGATCYGTTPEEADLMSGAAAASVSIAGPGYAVCVKKESLPVNVLTWVSAIVLPSFERMDSVYVLVPVAES
jgi:hypothetical protein